MENLILFFLFCAAIGGPLYLEYIGRPLRDRTYATIYGIIAVSTFAYLAIYWKELRGL